MATSTRKRLFSERLTVRTQIIALAIAGPLAIAIGVCVFVPFVERSMCSFLEHKMHDDMKNDLTMINQGVYNMVATQDELLRQKLTGDLAVAKRTLSNATLLEAAEAVQRVAEGDLDARGDASEVSGRYHDMITAVNTAMEAFNPPDRDRLALPIIIFRTDRPRRLPLPVSSHMSPPQPSSSKCMGYPDIGILPSIWEGNEPML